MGVWAKAGQERTTQGPRGGPSKSRGLRKRRQPAVPPWAVRTGRRAGLCTRSSSTRSLFRPWAGPPPGSPRPGSCLVSRRPAHVLLLAPGLQGPPPLSRSRPAPPPGGHALLRDRVPNAEARSSGCGPLRSPESTSLLWVCVRRGSPSPLPRTVARGPATPRHPPREVRVRRGVPSLGRCPSRRGRAQLVLVPPGHLKGVRATLTLYAGPAEPLFLEGLERAPPDAGGRGPDTHAPRWPFLCGAGREPLAARCSL